MSSCRLWRLDLSVNTNVRVLALKNKGAKCLNEEIFAKSDHDNSGSQVGCLMELDNSPDDILREYGNLGDLVITVISCSLDVARQLFQRLTCQLLPYYGCCVRIRPLLR